MKLQGIAFDAAGEPHVVETEFPDDSDVARAFRFGVVGGYSIADDDA